jgi:anaerobic magnesium-protoporphyrin IX monomethyl ester cyclase
MTDLLLIFVPQWSPFQPPLSLPSLAAWLRRAGYAISCLDANILLYDWLFSDECASLLMELVESKGMSRLEAEGYRSLFRCSQEFKRDIGNFKASSPPSSSAEKEIYVQKNFLAISAFSAYLASISKVSGDFSISPYSFCLNGDLQSSSLEAFADNPPSVIKGYLNWLFDHCVPPGNVRAIGLSCIGEEQLPFTLLFGRLLKQRFADVPVLVGGTILPRIFERGVLKPEWFGRYFDIVVRNEGEKPCEMILSNLRRGRGPTEDVPGIIYFSSGRICATQPAPPLKPAEVPTPDFDDLPLGTYFCSEITLPLLSARGCYWGKCEFCHHYMVYGDQYSAYSVQDVVNAINELARKYQVRHFAFNDEAIPPKVITALGQMLPDCETSGYTFTGLIKFERYFKREHFANLARVGFRSLYIGLESASERVLTLMKKPNTVATIKSNLRDASESGIWTHCFLFFGFPGETEDDARQTFDFIMSNPDIVGSFGCGTFVLEHNAPIQRHHESFNLTLLGDEPLSGVSVYYDYSVSQGISKDRAKEWMDLLNKESLQIDKYHSTTWIPREFLLCLISHQTPAELVHECIAIDRHQGLPPRAAVSDIVSLVHVSAPEDQTFMVNRTSARVVLLKNKATEVVELCLNSPLKAVDLAKMDPRFNEFLVSPPPPPEEPPALSLAAVSSAAHGVQTSSPSA